MLARNEAVGVSVFRKEAWRIAGGYCIALSGMHDWDLWIGILEAGYRATVIPEVLFEYRSRPQSMYSVTRRQENFQRLVGIIARRHTAVYQQYVAELIPLQARQFADSLVYHHQQLANRDRVAVGLRGELTHERRISNERHAWIEALEEAKQYFLGQLAAADRAKEDALEAFRYSKQQTATAELMAAAAEQRAAAAEQRAAAAELMAAAAEQRAAAAQQEAAAAEQKAVAAEHQTAETQSQLRSIQSSRTWRIAERVFGWVRRLRSAASV